MKIAVKDANVFIDMESMGILDLWFLLGYETLTSSLIVGELRKGNHRHSLGYIASDKIQVIRSTLDELEELFAELEPKGASLADVSVVHIAQQHNAMILTGDQVIRAEGMARGIECRGNIWILDQLVSREILRGAIAANKLEELMDLDGDRRRFLPKKECMEYIEAWRKK
ncbi:MAG: hypothetical protein KJT03_20620 [Verrucomicrobiae bacterium]|nr:hypothetical protein [Verrucomicrobiae bacterium]